MSINRKLTCVIMGITITAVLLTAAAIALYLIYDIRKSTMQTLEMNAAIAGDRNSAALVFLDAERVSSNLEIFRQTPSLLTACVFNTEGAIFASYRRQASSPPCPNQQALFHADKKTLSALQEIRQGSTRAGFILLIADTREIDAYMGKICYISLIATSLVLLLTLLFTIYFRRTISGPILELAALAQHVTDTRDYCRESSIQSMDETGKLAQAFNDMLKTVRTRDQELQEANETLEDKVSQRTAELEAAKAKAEAANEAKNEFLRNMSHEFRTPLHAILSFSSYGEREYEDAPRTQLKQYFDIIRKATNRLARLVDEVLDLAKLEHGSGVFNLRTIKLEELVTRATEMMQPLLKEKNLQIQFNSNNQAEVHCDTDKVVQVITNLLSNAVKFSPENSTLHMAISSAQENNSDYWQFSLRDEGVGIPENERESIFESFQQSSRTRTGAGGTGLGLAICRNIIEAHGGRIWAKNNQDGAGAEFRFLLPIVKTISQTGEKYENAA